MIPLTSSIVQGPGQDIRRYEKFKHGLDGRYWFKCTCSENFDGTILYCLYKDRFDRFKKAENHLCKYDIEHDQRTILSFIKKDAPNFSEVEIMIAEFIGSEDLPLHTCNSPFLKQLIKQAFDLGVKAADLCKSPLEKEDFYKKQYGPLSTKRVREIIVQIADTKRKNALSDFQFLKNNALSCDGVTIRNRKFLNFDIVNAQHENSPITVAVKSLEECTVDKFVEVFSEVLTSLISQGVEITAIITDGLPSQVRALNSEASDSLQSRFRETFGKLIFIPCVAHRLNNVIKFVYRTCPDFYTTLNRCRRLAIRLRSKNFTDNNGKR
jgi:hypothetical protein